jgi:hypothetical protein
MTVTRIAFVVAACVGLLGTVSLAQEKKQAFDPELPPCVVSAEPANRAKDVDPALGEIKVTFDRPMDTGGNWSWIIHQALGTYPGVRGGPPPRWENDGRTCVLSVKLKPGTLYAVGANSFRHTGFRDRKGSIAVPYAWVFKTRKAKTPAAF